MNKNCIASISTPLGRGAVAIVRLSGQDSLPVALSFFHSKKMQNNITPRYMYFGKIEVEENVFEECLIVYFKAPFSYTGEDIVEFQIHGGVLLAQKILDLCIKSGAKLAEPGEFSKRAFLNGKITLDKAEAIIGEINAETEGELRSSLQITNGLLAEQILHEQEKLKTLLAEIEVGMDYPEETDDTDLKDKIFENLTEIEKENFEILNVSKSAKFLKNGINVALVGKTNVGKSSVMNALLGENRAIVTDIQGTTRDSITESFLYNGIKINLIDTAGIRETQDLVENIGIEKSKQNLNSADIVLFVLDGSEQKTIEDEQIEQMLVGKNFITLVNKTDKKRVLPTQVNEIEISALQNKNIDALKEKILSMVMSEKIDSNALVLTNERQYKVLEDAQTLLKDVLTKQDIPLDVLAMLIKQIWQTLGKITGNTENEDIIDLIFSKFCLGK